MKNIFILLPLLWSGILFSQNKTNPVKKGQPNQAVQRISYKEEFKKISDEIMTNGKAYTQLRELTKNIGPRFAGSAGYARATDWAIQKLKEVGAENIRKEAVKVPLWVRGRESFQVKLPNGSWKSFKVMALGGSEGTEGKDLLGEIILVKDLQEFNALPNKDVRDKIIFFNVPIDQTIIHPGEAYLEVGKYRWSTPTIVGRRGAKAVITRSLTTAMDDHTHTGSMYYDVGDTAKIPAVTLGAQSADELAKLLQNKTLQGKLNLTTTTKGEATDYNIIAEIPGKKTNNIILIGAHLDTWDITEGAHDDGAGIVHCLEVLRAWKALGYENNHTIRVVFFANEENGVTGGNTYAENVRKKGERHIFAMESDSGGFSPRGIAMDMIPQRRRMVLPWKDYFVPYGVYDFNQVSAGQDILPLKKLNIPLAELIPDMQRYFDIHHTSEDTFDKVNRRELLLGAVTMAQMVFMVDRNW